MSENKPKPIAFEEFENEGKWWYWTQYLKVVGPFDTKEEASEHCYGYVDWLNRMDLGLD